MRESRIRAEIIAKRPQIGPPCVERSEYRSRRNSRHWRHNHDLIVIGASSSCAWVFTLIGIESFTVGVVVAGSIRSPHVLSIPPPAIPVPAHLFRLLPPDTNFAPRANVSLPGLTFVAPRVNPFRIFVTFPRSSESTFTRSARFLSPTSQTFTKYVELPTTKSKALLT